MNKEDRNFTFEVAIKALLPFLPGIGGLGSIAASFLGDISADRKIKRIEAGFRQLSDELNYHRDQISEDFVKQDDFLDLFEATFIRIANERNETKREAYKNILLSSALGATRDYDEVEYQIRILDQLMYPHIYLLKFFQDPDRFDCPKNVHANTYQRFFQAILPAWKADHIFDHISDLENFRLVEPITPDFKSMKTDISLINLVGMLTSKGASFVEFIIRD